MKRIARWVPDPPLFALQIKGSHFMTSLPALMTSPALKQRLRRESRKPGPRRSKSRPDNVPPSQWNVTSEVAGDEGPALSSKRAFTVPLLTPSALSSGSVQRARFSSPHLQSARALTPKVQLHPPLGVGHGLHFGDVTIHGNGYGDLGQLGTGREPAALKAARKTNSCITFTVDSIWHFEEKVHSK